MWLVEECTDSRACRWGCRSWVELCSQFPFYITCDRIFLVGPRTLVDFGLIYRSFDRIIDWLTD